MSEFIELCLPSRAPQHPGRGVRFELLSPTDRDAALISAAMLAGDDKIKLALQIAGQFDACGVSGRLASSERYVGSPAAPSPTASTPRTVCSGYSL